MKLSTPIVALAAIATTYVGVAHAQNTTEKGAQAAAGSILDALKAAGLTTLANLATTHSDLLLPYLTSPSNKTLLAPTNEAFTKLKTDVATMTPKQIAAVLSYHLLNGTILTSKLPDAFDYHVVVPTSLNDSELTNLPNGTHQVVVLQRSDSSEPIAIKKGDNHIHFASKVDGPSVGNIQIQPIEELLTPPGNLAALLSEEDDDLEGLHEALDKAQLRPALESTRGITIFAPESGAFSRVRGVLSEANIVDVQHALFNHVLNGTVLYSPQLPASEAENGETSPKTRNVTTAGGSMLTFTYLKNGRVQVSSGGMSASIVKSDVLLSNGVVHFIDGVLYNTANNATAAAKVAGVDQAKSSLYVSQPSTARGGSAKDGADLVATPSASLLLLGTVALAALTLI